MLALRAKHLALSSVFLALAAAPASAVTLSCTTSTGSAAATLRVDYGSGLIEELCSNGAAFRSATAQISATTIMWSTDYPGSYGSADGVTHDSSVHWEGRLDRNAGTGYLRSYYENLYHGDGTAVSCEEAKTKF